MALTNTHPNCDYHQPGQEGKMTKRGSFLCSLSCLKFSLYCYNILLLMFGLAGLCLGLWSLVDRGQFLSLLTTSVFQVSGLVILVSSSLVVLITLLGCCGISRESHQVILTYSGLLALTVLLQSTIGITAYIYRDQVSLTLCSSIFIIINSLIRSTRSLSSVSTGLCRRSTGTSASMTRGTPWTTCRPPSSAAEQRASRTGEVQSGGGLV